MFIGLISLLFFFNLSYAKMPPSHELEAFAFSRLWLNLYVYKKSFFSKSGYKSKSMEEKFFFSKEGRYSPLIELKQAILAFQDSKIKWGYVQLNSRCAFPARFQRLQERWPNLFQGKQHCESFNQWQGKLNASKISIIYAGAYPNNPASMFGHTILRIHNKKRNHLLDYNIGFQATINPEDNPVTYSIKGMFGGYPGFYNIEPYYVNIGLYNNAESRDMWQYDIDFTSKEIDFFIKHLWEVSLNTGFPYYFLDENCSYYLLTLVEATKPELDIISNQNTLIFPIEVLKSLANQENEASYRPSIKKTIKAKIKAMNKTQRQKFIELKNNTNKINITNDSLLLDTLNDYWKYKNYKKKGKLSPDEKKKMNLTLERRAALEEITQYPFIQSEIHPHQSHASSKFSLGYLNNNHEYLNLKFKWGYHGIEDYFAGFSRKAYIDFFSLSFMQHKDSSKIESIGLIDILSLEDFNTYLPDLSWHVSLKTTRICHDCYNHLKLKARGGVGLATTRKKNAFWGLIEAVSNSNLDKHIFYPQLQFGYIQYFSKISTSLISEIYHLSKINLNLNGIFNYYFSNNYSLNVNYKYQRHRNLNMYSLLLSLNY